MSLDTWKEEFYPIPADEAKGDALTAVEHSLKKWEGLRADNLTKHSCYGAGPVVGSDPTDNGGFDVNANTCALCKYNDALDVGCYCDSCPITMATGSPCDDGYEDGLTPWDEWTTNTNPEPMIAVLEATRKWLLDKHEDKQDD